jgi:SMC interacting uncharacterized protein involved in chromosome segregation
MSEQTHQARAVVQDNPSLERDMHSKAIVNRNRANYVQRMALRKSRRKKDEEIKSLKSEIDALKDLVHKLLQKDK